MSTSKWREQLERVRRYWRRLESLCDGTSFNRPAAEFVDDMHAFFVECHSFKDWLKNDPTFTRKNSDIERHVSDTPLLAICADFANGKKHLECTQPFRSGSEPEAIYYLEIIRKPDDADDQDNIVSPEARSSKREVNTEQADRILKQWLEMGVAKEDIQIKLVVDIKHQGLTLDLDRGVADFAFDAISAWEEFINEQC
ncbi:hypothetical protein N9B88_01220 [Rubripirellula sp.]|nr:hypothetical protein [Rubripirellula sp.]